MATSTTTDNSLKKLARPYETLEVRSDIAGGYILELRTHIILHRKHTNKTVFKYHSFYNAVQLTDYPVTPDFLKEILKRFREDRDIGLAKGEYNDEELISGEYQSVKRNYNQWFYWNHRDKQVVGKIHNAQS